MGASLEENMIVYEKGCPPPCKNIFVNYDTPSGAKATPPRTLLLEGFHPAAPGALSKFEAAIARQLTDCGVHVARNIIVLLDVSGSMAGKYASETHAAFTAWMREVGSPPVHRFNDGVIDEEPLARELLQVGWSALQCAGGTLLERAIEQTRRRYGDDAIILAVTDEQATEPPNPNVFYWLPTRGAPSVS